MSETVVYEWYKHFKEGGENVEDDDHHARCSTSITYNSIEEVRRIILKYQRITIRKVEDGVGI